MTMKVFIVSNNFPPNIIGGAEIVAYQLARNLFKLGHEVFVFAGDVTGSISPGSFVHDDQSESFLITRLGLSSHYTSWEHRNFSRPDLSAEISSLLECISPDVIHCHNLVGIGVDLIHIANRLGIPCLLTLHDHWAYCHRQTLVNTSGYLCAGPSSCDECQPTFIDIDGLPKNIHVRKEIIDKALKSLSLITAPSQYILDCFAAFVDPDVPTRRISNGRPARICDFEYKIPNKIGDGNRIVFGFASYFGEHKGIYTLINAVRALVDIGCTSLKVVMAGDGHEKEKLWNHIEALGLQEFFVFLGKLPHSRMYEFYESIDVFMLPSLWPENQPCTIMEARAFGLPVIGSDLGGVREIVEDYADGFLVSAGNFVELANTMRLFLDNPALLSSFSARALERASKESYAAMASEYLDIYSSLLAVSSGQP